MQRFGRLSLFFGVIILSSTAFSRGSPRAGNPNTNYVPDVKKGDGWAWSGKSASEYRPPEGLTTSKFEADVIELQRLRTNVAGIDERLNLISKTNDLGLKIDGKPVFSGKNNKELYADQERQKRDLISQSKEAKFRINELEERYTKALNDAKKKLAEGDSVYLQKLADRVKKSSDGKMEVSTDDVATAIARFGLMDLTSDIRDFLADAKDAQKDLKIVEAKLDQSVLGTYVGAKTAQLTQSKSFCKAVQNFKKDGLNCETAAQDDFAPEFDTKANDVDKYLKEKRGHKN